MKLWIPALAGMKLIRAYLSIAPSPIHQNLACIPYPTRYNPAIKRIQTTAHFTKWLDRLQDVNGRARVQIRIQRLARGNPGKHRNLKHGVSELKIDAGPGYRVYYTEQDDVLIVLLCGGDKPSQKDDIELAYQLVKGLESDNGN